MTSMGIFKPPAHAARHTLGNNDYVIAQQKAAAAAAAAAAPAALNIGAAMSAAAPKPLDPTRLKQLQTLLNAMLGAKGCKLLVVDGIMGPATVGAVGYGMSPSPALMAWLQTGTNAQDAMLSAKGITPTLPSCPVVNPTVTAGPRAPLPSGVPATFTASAPAVAPPVPTALGSKTPLVLGMIGVTAAAAAAYYFLSNRKARA